MRTAPVVACWLLAVCLTGCSGQKGANLGKTYTPEQNRKQDGGPQRQPQQSSAETVTGKPSAASDAGTEKASKGQVVVDPGAPAVQKKR